MIDEYKQIPLIKYESGNMCPLCHNALTEAVGIIRIYQQHEVKDYGTTTIYYQTCHMDFMYCNTCNIYYATDTILANIRKKYPSFTAYGFYTGKWYRSKRKTAIQEIIAQCNTDPPFTVKNKTEFMPYEKFKDTSSIERSKSFQKTKSANGAKPAKYTSFLKSPIYTYKGFRICSLESPIKDIVIHISNCKFDYCPLCSKSLRSTNIQIPISNTEGVNYSVKTCDTHYFSDLAIKELLDNNLFAQKIKTDFTYYFTSLYCAKDKSDTCLMHEIIMLAKDKSGKEQIIIFDKPQSDDDPNIVYLDYHEKYVRDILTDVIKYKKSTIVVNGIEYMVHLLDSSRVLNEINISEGGGYKYSKNHGEIVDALLYSPYTGRYEITRASYNRQEKLYYMDISVYKTFIKKYGNPNIVPIVLDYTNRSGNRFDDMNLESLLYTLGYNVSKNENLSKFERRSILAMAIDLNLMAQRDIVRFINWLISSHPSEKYADAREKWSADRDYISKYNANPERFIIAPDKYKM